MASEVLMKLPAVSFNQVKPSVEMSAAGQEISLVALPAPGSPGEVAMLQRVAQLEHNIRFLREQHHLMLTSLHKEVENLRQRNRELQFQLVMSSAAGSSPISLLQDVSSSPEDDTRPRVILSPRQPNLSPLQVEILEKDLAELRIDLKEERDKNQHLYGVVQEQQRKIEELRAVTLAGSRFRDAQCQAGAAGCAELGKKLEDAQRTIRSLRRDNDDQRRELLNVKSQLARTLQQQQQQNSRVGEERSYATSADPLAESHQENSGVRPATSGQRFPPLQNTGYWQQQQHHRPGMEFSGSSRSGHQHGRGGRPQDKEAASCMGGSRSGRTTLPALHNNSNTMFMQFPQNNQRRRQGGGHYFYNNNNNGGAVRQGNYFRNNTAEVVLREDGSLDGIQGRKYRGGRGQRERQLQ